MVQFIHAADIHLDSPFVGLKALPDFVWNAIYQSTFKALTNLVDLAIEKKVDFVCLVGDIYDNDDRSVKAQAYLRNEMERLRAVNIPVYLLHGNHDYIEQKGLHLEMPENVHIFGPVVETMWLNTKSGERVALTGFSYDKRWITDRKIQEFPEKAVEADVHIGLLHGFSEGLESEHGKYAPFSVAELKSKHYDYWALGHIHTRNYLSKHPPIVYPGNTQGRSSKERGSKGVELVTISATKEEAMFYSTATIRWETIQVSVKDLESLESVYRLILEEVKKQHSDTESVFLSIELTDAEQLLEQVRKKIQQGELLEAFQQTTAAPTFVWVHKIELLGTNRKSTPSIIQIFPEEWQKAMDEVYQEKVFNELTNSFFDYSGAEDFLDARDEAYRQKILNRVKEEVGSRLGTKGSDEDED